MARERGPLADVVAPFESGQSVGRYRIVRTLGSGAMGVVYLAQDPQIDRMLAIKTVRFAPGEVTEPDELAERRERLLREAKTAGRLIHPNIVTLFDAGEHEGTLYLAFEYVEGSDLAQRIREGAPLSLAEALRITAEAASGLAFAHRRGIVHRDVKPANILLTADGRVKISDFGIAKVLGQATELTMTGTVVGSPHYLSPEQVRGEPLDGRSDLFSLGVVLYELLGARRPFDGETITTLLYQILHQEPPPMPFKPGLSPRLVELLSRLLAKDRDDRYANGDELVAALAALETELPTEVLATPAVVLGAGGQLEPTRMLSITGAQPAAPGTRPAEAPGEPPATRAPAVPPPPGAVPPPPPVPETGSGAAPSQAVAAPPKRRRAWLVAAVVAAILALGAVAVAVGGYLWWRGGGAERVAGLMSSAPEAAAPEEGATADDEASTEEAASQDPVDQEPAGGRARIEEAGEETAPPPAVPAVEPAPTRPAASPAPSPSPVPPSPVPRQESQPARPAPEPAAEPEPSIAADSGTDRPLSPRGRRLERALEKRPEVREALEDAIERTAPDQEVETGLSLVFDVDPPQAFALLDGTVVGRAAEYDARSGRSYVLPGAGEYVLKLRSPGMQDYRILVRASDSGPARTTIQARLSAAAASELALGDLPLVRVQEAVGFQVVPGTALVEVDGRPVGRAERYPGRFARPATWLRLAPGRHRVSLVAPGYRRKDFAVDVSAGASEERQRIEARLEPAPGGP